MDRRCLKAYLPRYIVVLASLLSAYVVRAQTDTVRYMHYNLLNYGNSNAANRPNVKNQRLSATLQYVQPDLLSVNEMFSDSTLRDSLLLALGTGWEKTLYSNQGNATQTNTLFFKSATFRLRSQTVISSNLRDIIAYRLQYRDTITHPHDTVFFTAVVCHFKASDGSADEAERAIEAGIIAAYLNASGPGNYVLAGDLNVYYSAEPAYQNLVANPNLSARLYDPINRPGFWHSDNAYADVHTQSPRASNLGDGGVAGGLDDRFDQILVSGPVMNDGAGMKYSPGSYKAVGQDGLHFNAAIIDAPVNASAPGGVIQALHLASDHLPVAADFILHTSPLPASVPVSAKNYVAGIKVLNPVDNRLEVHFPSQMMGDKIALELHTTLGQQTFQTRLTVAQSVVSISLSPQLMHSGQLFFLTITDGQGNANRTKLVKR